MGKTFARLDTYDLKELKFYEALRERCTGGTHSKRDGLISKKTQDEFSFDVGGALGQRDFQRQN